MQAYLGALPDGNEGFEFYALARPDAGVGYVMYWRETADESVRVEDDALDAVPGTIEKPLESGDEVSFTGFGRCFTAGSGLRKSVKQAGSSKADHVAGAFSLRPARC